MITLDPQQAFDEATLKHEAAAHMVERVRRRFHE
jgi:hypothetical protein